MITRAIAILLLSAAINAHADQPVKVDSTKAGATKASPEKLNWLPFESIQKTFPVAPRPLFLYISQHGCEHCTMMDTAVFVRSEIVRFVNANFTPVRVDIYLNTPLKVRDSLLQEEDFRRLLSIDGIPAYYFFDTAGQVIGVLDSSMDLLKFKRMLVYVTEGHFFRTPWVKFMELPQASAAAIEKRFRTGSRSK